MPDADYRVSAGGCRVPGEGSTAGYQFLCSSAFSCPSPLVCRMLPAAGLLGCNLAHLGPGSLLVDAAHCKIGSSRAANAAGKVTASGGLTSPARPMQTPYTHIHTHTHTQTGTFTVARALLISKSSECYYSVIYSTNATAAASAFSLLSRSHPFSPLPFSSPLPVSVCTHVHKCKANKHTGTPSHDSHIVRCHGHFTFCAHVGFCLSTPSPHPRTLLFRLSSHTNTHNNNASSDSAWQDNALQIGQISLKIRHSSVQLRHCLTAPLPAPPHISSILEEPLTSADLPVHYQKPGAGIAPATGPGAGHVLQQQGQQSFLSDS